MVQVITLPNTSGDSVPDIHDDMTRELAFYTAAKTSADDAIHRFDGASIPWQRPPDYYAESVKSDGHMAKVKEQLMFEEQAIEMAEQRYAFDLHQDSSQVLSRMKESGNPRHVVKVMISTCVCGSGLLHCVEESVGLFECVPGPVDLGCVHLRFFMFSVVLFAYASNEQHAIGYSF